jgi:putative ABC transport system permease protein
VSALATSLRIARRDAVRFKARSALVVLMIALPVLGVGVADVLYRTFQLSPEQKATRVMGSAQATYLKVDPGAITQDAAGHLVTSGEAAVLGPTAGQAVTLSGILPRGSTVLTDASSETDLTAGSVTTRGSLRALDYTPPLASGLYTQVSGRSARTADELVLTDAYARRLHVGRGDTVMQRGRTIPYTVVGVVADASSTSRLTALVRPGADSGLQAAPSLVSLPRPLTWSDVRSANAAGFLVRPRHVLPGSPPSPPASGSSSSTLTAVSLIVGMVLLEIILLAGPAFAVGAKRQSRDLALLAATGGERRDVRRTVLASGVVLGTVGGIVGVVTGIALAYEGRGQITSRTSTVPGPFDVRPLDLAGLALVGVMTAVLAAVIPARNASRQDVVAALTGRRGQLRSLRRTPVIGVIVAVLGTVIAFRGAEARSVNTILAGSALAELGLVATTPFLVGLVGRLSPWLPLGPRLALRDASRNRGRTAPAVSAVLAAVAGSVAVGTYFASTDRFNAEAYQPTAPRGAITVPFDSPEQQRRLDDVVRTLKRTAPGVTVTVVRAVEQYAGRDGSFVDIAQPTLRRCFVQPGGPIPTRTELLAAAHDPACHGHSSSSRFAGRRVVGGPDVLRALSGEQSDAYAAVLAQGGMIGSLEEVDQHGHAALRVLKAGVDDAHQHVRELVVPAASLPREALQVEVLSPAAARLTGLRVLPIGVVARRAGVPSSTEEDESRKALQDLGVYGLQVERGYQSTKSTGLLALLIGSAVIVLGASGIATGLAAADGRADLATLAAVGADPTTRRTLAAFQSAVTAGLGTLLGAVAGLVPAIGMVRALNASALHASFPRLNPYPLVLPWTNILVTVLVVPLVAALAAALLTRSKLPLVRRLA